MEEPMRDIVGNDREDWVPELGLIRLESIIRDGIERQDEAIEIAQRIIVAQRELREELE
jgi:hypothetical protein